MKVYMMTDFEGISGVRTMEEAQTGSPEYQAARKFLCGDVNAAVAGAFDGGATEVVVRDGHGGGFNLILDLMDPRGLYTGRGGGSWCPGLDQTFQAAFFVGAHAMAGTAKAFLEHTQSSKAWLNYSVNGRSFGELGQFGAYCGSFGIPVVLVTGDEAACREAAEFFPGCEAVSVKRATSRNSAICIHPQKAQEMIRAGAQRALKRAKPVLARVVKPFVVKFPAQVVMEYMRTDFADGMASKRGVERVNSRTVRWTAASAEELLL
jgi:D-amino peptidase